MCSSGVSFVFWRNKGCFIWHYFHNNIIIFTLSRFNCPKLPHSDSSSLVFMSWVEGITRIRRTLPQHDAVNVNLRSFEIWKRWYNSKQLFDWNVSDRFLAQHTSLSFGKHWSKWYIKSCVSKIILVCNLALHSVYFLNK